MRQFVIGVVLALTVALVSAGQASAAAVDNLTFKNTDIKVVLQAIAQLASKDGKDINIITAPGVEGEVSVDLVQVDWETALKVILRSYNFTSSRHKNVIMVSPSGAANGVKTDEIQVKVFRLKFIDANDAKAAIVPLLSGSGKLSVLETTGQNGWEFGSMDPDENMTKAGLSSDSLKRTKTLVVVDMPDKIDQISTLLEELDVMPKQILIKTRIMEVNYDLLRDIGVDWGTGSEGARSPVLNPVPVDGDLAAGHSLALTTPSAFTPKSTGLTALNSGLSVLFENVAGTDFEVVLHALEEDTRSNTLSAPVIMTLNNQEATILIGTKYPIINTDTSSDTGTIVGGSLDEYQDIGIQLNVVPQIVGDEDDFINLIVHPAVSTYNSTAKVVNSQGTTLVEYPIIQTREAETQLLVKSGGTAVLGGLMKDVKTEQVIGVPFLSKLPFLGAMFRRTVNDTEKIELLIFITAQIVTPGNDIPTQILDTSAAQSAIDKAENKDGKKIKPVVMVEKAEMVAEQK